MKKEQSEKIKSFLELKIISKNLNELEKLIECYKEIGFIHDGTIIEKENICVAFLCKNNGLINI